MVFSRDGSKHGNELILFSVLKYLKILKANITVRFDNRAYVDAAVLLNYLLTPWSSAS